MKKTLLLLLAIPISLTAQKPAYKQAGLPVEQRVADLLSRMTNEEKIGQLCCPLGWEMYEKQNVTGKNSSNPRPPQPSGKFKQLMQESPVGGFWATLRADPWTRKTLTTGLDPKQSAMALNELQRYALENTRLGIPLLFAEEAPHGHMAIGTTVFPTSLSCASTWNPELMRQMGEAIALELRSQGGNIGYGPVLDIAREPRWSRMEETFGEDPWLTATMGTEVVRGMQGDDPADGSHVYSTLKHLAAYGVPESGHNGGPVYAGERLLRSQLLLPFEKAVKGGAATVMTSYNSIDGIPCTSNRHLLTDILRGEWGFKGFVFSDLLSIEGICGHRVASNNKEASALAIKAGLDMDLGGGAFGKNLQKALDEGLVSMSDIDRAVCNVLRMKFRMGLFENPYVDPDKAARVCRSEKHKSLAERIAEEGTVLLKNNGVLPLSRSQIKRLAVIGPNANSPYNQLGDYTAPQPREAVSTVLDGIKSIAGEGITVDYEVGCAIRDTASSNLHAAAEAARKADAVVLVVGGSSARDFKTEYIATGAASTDASSTVSDMDCGEGFDRSTLSLLGKQEALIDSIAAVGKPLVVIYIEGRTLLMNNAAKKADALLTAWYPGAMGGKAIASILFGDVNPSGHLPVSIPSSEGQLPIYYAQGELRPYTDGPATPLFPFGHGLSYTSFAYSNLNVIPQNEYKDSVNVSLMIENTGHREGEEVVQLYLTDRTASVSQPPKQLRGFKRIYLKPGERKMISFGIGFDELSLIDENLKRTVEPGIFDIAIGASSADIRLNGSFNIK